MGSGFGNQVSPAHSIQCLLGQASRGLVLVVAVLLCAWLLSDHMKIKPMDHEIASIVNGIGGKKTTGGYSGWVREHFCYWQ